MKRIVFRMLRNLHDGSLKLPFAFGVSFLGISWTILEATGISGSSHIINYLIMLSVIAFLLSYIYLSKRYPLKNDSSYSTSSTDMQKKIEFLVQDLEPTISKEIKSSIQTYENVIADLRSQITPLNQRNKPVLVEGGVQSIVGNIEVKYDSFLIDSHPVTNQEFSEFISAPQGKDWLPAKVVEIYGIPYYLCEFIGGNAPEDKWDHPVVWVSWYAAVAFCNWRSIRDGKTPVYIITSPYEVQTHFENSGWRLPRRSIRKLDSV